MNTIEMIPVGRILPHPENPRKDLGDLSELTESIRAKGILQNLTVVGADQVTGLRIPDPKESWYVAVIGHRRLAAAKAAGLETVPCVLAGMSRKEQLSTMLLENMQRSDLTPYEQAQGFHQLALLGCNIAEISKRSGFSRTTVKRRLEMAQLDQKVLQKVSESRQLSLGDFEKLGQLEDLQLRNRVLQNIGTRDFEEALARAKQTETIRKRQPEVRQWLQDHRAKPLPEGVNTYGSRYTSMIGGAYRSYIRLARLGENGNTLPTDGELDADKQLFYQWQQDESVICLFYENPNPVGSSGRGPKTEAEKDRDRTMREVRARIRELSELHYGLRKAFVEELTVTGHNREKVLAGALAPALYFAHCAGGHPSAAVSEKLGLKKFEYHTDVILEALEKLQEKELAGAVYAIYNDSPENWFADDMNAPGTIPSWRKDSCNVLLQLLYKWLTSLGYEPSTEELALKNGTHELYRRGKKK